MEFYFLLLLFSLFYFNEAGVTEIRPDTSEGEVVIETVSEDTWMPSNILDAQVNKGVAENENKVTDEELPWNADSNPLFKAIRDFIFQAGDGLEETEDHNDDPTEEIVKMLEKGLIEASTMFLTPSDDELVPSIDAASDPISVVKIENDASETMIDRMGLNVFDFPSERQALTDISNTTTACSNCYNTLESCVLQCFMKNNCNDVQRQSLTCPPITGRLCNIFTQWDPVQECRVHEDCKSPLLCCSDGCVNKCSPGVWLK